MLFQLLYISLSKLPTKTATLESDVAKVLSASYINNEKDGVTGVLLYAGGYFCQLIEGEEAAVDRVFSRIERDSRHHRIQLIFRRPAQTALQLDHPMMCAGIEPSVDSVIADTFNLGGSGRLEDAGAAVMHALLRRLPKK